MARPMEFPGNAPGTVKAIFSESFPPEGAPVGPPVAPEAPPIDVVAEPPVDPATGLPMLPVDEVLAMSGLEEDDLPGGIPDEILNELLF